MLLLQLICVTRFIGLQLRSASHRIVVLVWSGGASLVAPLHIFVSSAVRYLVYPAVEPSVLSFLANSWYLLLLLQVGSITPFSIVVPPPGIGSPWRSSSCLRIMKLSALYKLLKTNLCRRGWAGAPLSKFLEGMPYKFFNE